MADKPRKPYPTFPLTPHVRGGWGKKYKGQQLYLADADPIKALERFHRLARQIDSGTYAPSRAKAKAEATVYDVCNRYVFERGLDRDAGRLSKGAWEDYDDAAAEMIECFGFDTRIDELGQDQFTDLYRALAKRLGPHALGRMIQACRTIWNHADANDWIDRRPKFGTVFRKPLADKKAGVGFTVEQARVLIACAVGNVQLEAMLLLMLNGGYQAMDCAKLPRAAGDRRRVVDRQRLHHIPIQCHRANPPSVPATVPSAVITNCRTTPGRAGSE